jgi:hypothetical protein
MTDHATSTECYNYDIGSDVGRRLHRKRLDVVFTRSTAFYHSSMCGVSAACVG